MKLRTDIERQAIEQGLNPLLAMGLSHAALLAYVKAHPVHPDLKRGQA